MMVNLNSLFLYRVGLTSAEVAFWFSIPWVVMAIASFFLYLKTFDIHLLRIFSYLKALSPEEKKILQKDFKYYTLLTEAEKLKFEKRIRHFLVNKKFTSTEMTITKEMQVLIAASLVQLTFGLPPVFLAHFNVIRIFKNTPAHRKKQAFDIGWEDFLNGYADAHDGYNPGLQKMATLLSLEHRVCKDKKYIFYPSYFFYWRRASRNEATRLVNTGLTKFKSVKEVNEDEYFAAAVVYFFEKPEDFKARFPDLYKALCYLLNQQPLKRRK